MSEYRQEGYAGSLVRFSDLTFPQVSELISAAGAPGEKVRMEIRRAGNRVVVDGAVDLTTVDVDRADFQLKIAFPGQVLDANGEADSGEVSWTFDAGEVGDIEAVVAFDDPDAPSPVNWSIGLFLVVALAAWQEDSEQSDDGEARIQSGPPYAEVHPLDDDEPGHHSYTSHSLR